MQRDHYLKMVSCEKLIPFLVSDSVFSEDDLGDLMIDLSGRVLGDGNVGLGIKSTVPHLRPRSAPVSDVPKSSSLVGMFVVVFLSGSLSSNSESTSSSMNLMSCRTSRTGDVALVSSSFHR